jgi:hypothetical protein
MSKSYNGWTNYETWCVALWIDNEQRSHDYWRTIANDLYEAVTPHDVFTNSERARYDVADRLKEEIGSEGLPELGASMYADLLNAALSEVDWPEIANSLLTDCDGYEPMPERVRAE